MAPPLTEPLLKTPLAVLLALYLTPALALAQSQEGGLGIDLTQPEEKKEEQPQQPPSPESAPGTAAAAEPAPNAPGVPDLLGEAERAVTQEDRVKSVQRKMYLKKGRFELSPSVFFTVNDPYYNKWGGSLRAAYYLADTLSLAARGSLMDVTQTDDVQIAKRAYGGRIFFSEPIWSAMGDVEWSPFYGKVAWFNSILHFDAYLLGGLGVMNTATSALPEGADPTVKRGLHPSAEVGVGMRFVAKDFLAVNVALINTAYVDQPAGTTKGALQNVMTLNAGISLFLPLRSTGREAE